MKGKFENIKSCLHQGMSFKDIYENFGFPTKDALQTWYYHRLSKKTISKCDRCEDVNVSIIRFKKLNLCGTCLIKEPSTKCENLKNIQITSSEYIGLCILANQIVKTIEEDIYILNKNKNKTLYLDRSNNKYRKIRALKIELYDLLYNSKYFETICDSAGTNIEYIRRKAKEKIDNDIDLF